MLHEILGKRFPHTLIISGFARYSSYKIIVLDKSITRRYAVEKVYRIRNIGIGYGNNACRSRRARGRLTGDGIAIAERQQTRRGRGFARAGAGGRSRAGLRAERARPGAGAIKHLTGRRDHPRCQRFVLFRDYARHPECRRRRGPAGHVLQQLPRPGARDGVCAPAARPAGRGADHGRQRAGRPRLQPGDGGADRGVHRSGRAGRLHRPPQHPRRCGGAR